MYRLIWGASERRSICCYWMWSGSRSCLSTGYVSILFFFFSSRRRHTRYIGDWSSDVCSSDLGESRQRADRREYVSGQANPNSDRPLRRRRVAKAAASAANYGVRRRCRDGGGARDRKSTRLNSSHRCISYAVFCLKKKKKEKHD